MGSLESTSSTGSRRGKTRQYYTVSKTSNVDESLFGTPNNNSKTKSNAYNDLSDDPFASKRTPKGSGRRKSDGKETVKVITKDLIRNLIVPKEDPSGQTLILSRDQFFRIMDASRVLTQEE